MLCESLESRRFLSVSALQAGGTLIITGTSGDDSISINEVEPGLVSAVYYEDGEPISLSDEGFIGVEYVILTSGTGNDTLNVTLIDADALVLAGSDNDTINLDASGNADIVGLAGDGNDVGSARASAGGEIIVLGGNGNDGLPGLVWSLEAIGTGSTVSFSGGNGNDIVTIAASGGGVVTANGDNGNDSFDITTVGEGSTVITKGGNGNDAFAVFIIDTGGTVTVDGGNGNDSLVTEFDYDQATLTILRV